MTSLELVYGTSRIEHRGPGCECGVGVAGVTHASIVAEDEGA